MVILHFVNAEEREEASGVLRSHAVESRKISRVITVSKEKSKKISKRGRDAIIAAFNEDRI